MPRRLTTEEFIEKARKIHGNKYDYSKIEYKGCSEKICIICHEHGEFWQEAIVIYRGVVAQNVVINGRVNN